MVNKADQRAELVWLRWNGWCSASLYSSRHINEVRLVEWAWGCFAVQKRCWTNFCTPCILIATYCKHPWWIEIYEAAHLFWGNECKLVRVNLCRDPWLPPPAVSVSFHHPCLSSITSISHNLASWTVHPLPPLICPTCLHPKYSFPIPSKE